jgi:hypothetical protein
MNIVGSEVCGVLGKRNRRRPMLYELSYLSEIRSQPMGIVGNLRQHDKYI